MKEKRLIDSQVVATFPSVKRMYWNWWEKKEIPKVTAEKQYAADLKSAVSEFHDFLRDHRSQDLVSLDVDEKYQDVCSFCGAEWETSLDEAGIPICCAKAQEEVAAPSVGEGG